MGARGSTQLTNHMNELPKVATEIAAKSASDPNYLPIVLLIACLAGFVWLFKWLVGRLDQQTELLAGLFKEANEGRVKLAEVVAVNSTVVTECRDAMRENTDILRNMRSNEARKVGI